MDNDSLGFDEWDETNLKNVLRILQENDGLKLTLSYKNGNHMNEKITKLLAQMGVPSNLKGYSYLRTALKLCIMDRSELDGVTKCVS